MVQGAPWPSILLFLGLQSLCRTSPGVFAKEEAGVTVCAVDVGVPVPICVWICV